jgi:dienelactone hydrolase
MEQNLLGSYGSWAAALTGKMPGSLSLRSGRFEDLEGWRIQARQRVWECLAAPELPETPEPTVEWREEADGLRIEKLSWQLPYGPRTDAVFLKPADAGEGQLPAILALHDHGGMKYFGWRKIAQRKEPVHPLLQTLREQCYGGRAWANELARRGYAVLIPDTFTFGSRRVRIADVPATIARNVSDPEAGEDSGAIVAYNRWAGEHESILAKSLFSAGTTWPGVTLRDDQVALSILCARPDVDAKRVGCGGLSGGGLRTVYLGGMDARIRCCFCAGFMTTWKDQVYQKSFTHTWMTFAPLLARDLDFPEILGLRAPMPALVLHCTEDPLFTNSEAEISGQILQDVYTCAGSRDAFRFQSYPGGHQFNGPMQEDAFTWFDRWLKA